mmetsp:Transcript_113419/g.177278  ORF Transcript_113419/g.177278 Transcript_113419/m.177278 type:complete len:240 (+) Transcript_113419:73-792(+)
MKKDGHSLQIGTRVLITNQDNAPGIVKFIGNTDFSAGVWVGVALDKQVGKNDGSVQGKKYFECPPGHGIFVRQQVCAPEGAAEDDAKRIQAKKALAMACEEHDLEEIARMLEDDEYSCLSMVEKEAAQRILMSDVQQLMIMEITEVREAVDSLVDQVAKAQKVCDESAAQAGAKPSAKAGPIPDAWLREVGDLITGKMSMSCVETVNATVDETVANSASLQQLAVAAEKLGQQRKGPKT